MMTEFERNPTHNKLPGKKKQGISGMLRIEKKTVEKPKGVVNGPVL